MIHFLDYRSPTILKRPGALFWHITRSALCLIFGVALPLACFYFAVPKWPGEVRWQSGAPGGIASLLLSGRVHWPLYPILLHALLSLSVACISQKWAARQSLIRLGVYGGLCTAFLFGILFIFLFVSDDNAWEFHLFRCLAILIALALALPLAAALVVWTLYLLENLTAKQGHKIIWIILLILTLTCVTFYNVADNRLIGAAAFILLASPASTIVAFAWMSAALWRATAYSAPVGPSVADWSTWSLVQTAGWIVAIQNAIVAYGKLPISNPPGCYIATAAQNGHPFLVRSQRFGPLRVNNQLRTLKAFEIALLTLFPRLHFTLRFLYNRLGPPLARRISNPYLADAAYLALKPLEWLASLALVLLRATWHAHSLYQG